MGHDVTVSRQPRKNGLNVNGHERDTPDIEQTNQSSAGYVKEELSPTRQNQKLEFDSLSSKLFCGALAALARNPATLSSNWLRPGPVKPVRAVKAVAKWDCA